MAAAKAVATVVEATARAATVANSRAMAVDTNRHYKYVAIVCFFRVLILSIGSFIAMHCASSAVHDVSVAL